MRIISGSARGTKLYTLEGKNTRPTLDRVKEPLFSIIQKEVKNATVLDLFSGSGALAIEALSRGAEKAVLCDISSDAVKIIKKNLEKTHLNEKATVVCTDFQRYIKESKDTFDIIFIDPPYEANIAIEAVHNILNYNLLKPKGIIIIETDDENRELLEIKKMKYSMNIFDSRKYGRVKLLFLNREG